MATKEEVLEVFAKSEKPLKVADVAAALGVERPEVDKAIKELKTSGAIYSPKNCFYTVAKAD